MNRIALFLILTMLFSCKTQQHVSDQKKLTHRRKKQAIVTQGLVAHFPLNKTAADISGNRNNGRIIGGVTPTTDRFGNNCGAMAFNGRDGYITVPSSSSLESPESLTIAGWFKIDPASPFADLKWVTMVCKSPLPQEADNSPQYRLQLTNQTISLNTDFTEEVYHPFYFDQWHFYAMTYNRQQVVSYLDGQKVFEFPYYRPLSTNKFPLEIGRDIPGKIEYFGGCMDDIRIYDRALSQAEVMELYRDDTDKNASFGCEEKKKDIPVRPVVENTQEELDFQHTIEVNNKEITVYIYDHAKPDGDIVSINVNGQWYVDKHKLKRKNKKIEKTEHFTAQLKPNQDNILYSKAWNLGKNPPNTLTLEIHDNFNKPQRVILNSKIGKSGAVRIRCVL